jgi:hypothetical protein
LPAVEVEDETAKKPRARPSDETIPPKPRSNPRGVVPDELSERGTQAAQGGGGGKAMTIVAVLLVLGLLGGGGWAVTQGPLAAMFKEEPVVVDTGPKRIDTTATPASGDKPKWVLEKEEEERKLAEERARQLEIEEAAADPDRLALLQEITAQIEQLNRLEEEQRQLKIEARQGKQETAANAKRIDDLQKQISDLKDALKEKEERKNSGGGKRGDPNTVQVVKDAKGAKANSVGYLSLRTANPSSAAVFLGSNSLGSTPLIKMPIEAGVHQLRVVDGDSKDRLLSVTIAASLTVTMLGRIVRGMVSLSAGVLLGTALLHVLPEAFESSAGARELFLTLLAGLLFFWLLEKAELYRHAHHHEGDGHHHHHGGHRPRLQRKPDDGHGDRRPGQRALW